MSNVRSLLFRFYWRLEKILFPALKYSQYHYYDTLKQAIPPQCSWLDLGCGHQMFASWMAAEERELSSRSRRLIGIDLDLQGLKKNQYVSGKVFGNLEQMPFEAGMFDVVTANMVVEHLADPTAVLREVLRVLRPGGLFIFHTPNVRSVLMRTASLLPNKVKTLAARILENRKEEDVFPTFYRMNTPAAIETHARSEGFDLKQMRSVSSSAITVVLGPLSAIELLYLRFLERDSLKGFRSNLIAQLQKPGGTHNSGQTPEPSPARVS